MSILKLETVAYHYQGTTTGVLKDLSIEFKKGMLYVIMGKSGVGKSTLLSLIAGLDNPTKGSVLFKGDDLKCINKDEYRSKNIGVIFQSYNLLTNATALDNVVLSMNISGRHASNNKEVALDLLSEFGIDSETAHRKVLKLSGGEQQRVGIVRALSYDPDIIVADEPTGNLDNDTEETIMNALQSLAHQRNKCVIVVSHSKRVSQYADEHWGLTRGTLVFIK